MKWSCLSTVLEDVSRKNRSGQWRGHNNLFLSETYDHEEFVIFARHALSGCLHWTRKSSNLDDNGPESRLVLSLLVRPIGLFGIVAPNARMVRPSFWTERSNRAPISVRLSTGVSSRIAQTDGG
ncbi:hypothetical protein [Sphingomonas zeae]|jgi:hypothetical protein|uniref:hypothetical protein n=1 Tax=Sphingomonas zeae TaxID=1646122 RepID=UPI0025515752|nr:hypothetical protein [Sphingomonas zeae]